MGLDQSDDDAVAHAMSVGSTELIKERRRWLGRRRERV
jgi:hypothetical protein